MDIPDDYLPGISLYTIPKGGIPANAEVTMIHLHHQITHPYIYDINVDFGWMEGTDYLGWNIFYGPDDALPGAYDLIQDVTWEGDFGGLHPDRAWRYRVIDMFPGDVGAIRVFQLWVYYVLAEPDLEPYQPSGWDEKLVISNVTGTTTTAPTIYDDESIYVDYSVVNSGMADAGAFRYGLYLDGVLRKYVDRPSLAEGYYSYVLDSSFSPLSAGTHTFEVRADYNSQVTESDETNNNYSRTFTVQATSPDLAPYTPAGWSDAIVISTQTGTNTDDSPILDTDTIYVDMAWANLGGQTTGPYRADILLDGSLWGWFDIASHDGYSYRYSEDIDFGVLAAGWHSVGMVLDSAGAVSESNEGNNTYTRNFTVADTIPPNPDPMTWQTEPYETSTSSISMTGTAATDASLPVEYQFDFYSSPTGGSGGTDSSWGTSRTYVDSGLQPNHQYGYRVRARDSASPPNVGGYSSPISYDYTLANPPGTAAFSDVTQTSIRANWTSNGNPGGTEYLSEDTTRGTNSGWTTNTYWNETGLNPGQEYAYRVKSRNGDDVETVVTDLGSQSTLSGDLDPPTVDSFSPADNATGVAVNANLVIDFSEDVAKGSGNILIKQSSDDTVVETILVSSAQVTIFNDLATIDPLSVLAAGTGYYVQIAPGAFEDLSGNAYPGISDKTTWNFTTGATLSFAEPSSWGYWIRASLSPWCGTAVSPSKMFPST